VTDILETLAPVSTLIPGLSVEAPAAAAMRAAEGGGDSDRSASQAIGAAMQQAVSISVPPVQPLDTDGSGKAGGNEGGWRSSATDLGTTAAVQAGGSQSADSLFQTLITLATPAESPITAGSGLATRPSVQAAQQPVSAGSAGAPVPNPTPVASGRSASGTAPTSTPSAPTALAGAQSGPGTIRLMSLPANQPVHRTESGGGLRPEASSGGGGGGLTGDPFITYSGDDGARNNTLNPQPNFSDLAGDTVQLTIGDNNGYQILSVKWSISPAGHTTGPQNVVYNFVNRTGYTIPQYTPPTQFVAPNPLYFDWDQNSGSYVITATVNYVNTSIPQAQASMSVPVVRPSGNITVNSIGTPTLIPGTGTSTLSSAPLGTVGISFTASVNPTTIPAGLDGTIEVVQTINPFTVVIAWSDSSGNHAKYISVSNPPGGPQTMPRPVVDDSTNAPAFVSTYYMDEFTAVSSSTPPASAILPLSDTPSVSFIPVSNKSVGYYATFTDTLMFTPGDQVNGYGNDVPLGYFTWTVSMAAADSGGVWTNGSLATTATGYTPTTAYPSWVESNYWLWSTYGQFVQVS
jgi:hypothetical protein